MLFPVLGMEEKACFLGYPVGVTGGHWGEAQGSFAMPVMELVYCRVELVLVSLSMWSGFVVLGSIW